MEANGINTNFCLETGASTELTALTGTFCFAGGTGLLSARRPHGSAPGTASPLGVSPATPPPSRPEGLPPESVGSVFSSPVSPQTLRPHPTLAPWLPRPAPPRHSLLPGAFPPPVPRPPWGGCWSRKPHPLRSPPWEWLLGTSFHDQDDSGRWRPCDWPHFSLWALKQGSCDSVSPLALGPLGGALGGVLVHAGPCSLLSARAARSAADLLHTLWATLVSRLRHFGRLVATRQPCHARGR